MVEPTKQMMADAHKVAFFVDQYPEHSLKQIIELFKELPPVDTNVAIWTAVDQGLVETDTENDTIKLVNKPTQWNFGEHVQNLEAKIEYAFHKIAENESDLEEVYFGNWTLGYAASDVLVATRHLMAREILASYDVEDTDKDGSVNTYTFYTLVANVDKHWGLKQFKKPPVPGLVDPKRPETPTELPDAEEAAPNEEPTESTTEDK